MLLLSGIGDINPNAPPPDHVTYASRAGSSLTFDPITVTGDPPPSLLRTAAPYLIGAAVIAALSWLAYAGRRRRRARAERPFVG